MKRRAFLLSLLVLLTHSMAQAEEPEDEDSGLNFNLVVPTFGGQQFWTDEKVSPHYRIQRNVISGHFRLLDSRDFRRAWGSYEQCLTAEADLASQDKDAGTMPGHVIFVLHGIIRSRDSVEKMQKYLQQEFPEAAVLTFGYASTRAEIGDHAAALDRVIARLEPSVRRIDFVGHSMGNLVVRHYLGDCECRQQVDRRIGRIVMVAAPNGGSRRAEAWAWSSTFKTLFGDAGQQLAKNWETVMPQLATPCCEFGIVAGAKGDGEGWKDLLPGDDDGTVSVATTRLPGARDFITVPCKHTYIMDNEQAQEYVAKFLHEGYFVSRTARHPILEEDADEPFRR